MTYTTHAGAHPEIQINDLDRLTLERWLLALRRRLAYIRSGVRLQAEDSTAIGDKYTECSWGMCGEEPALWPDAQDHTFPLDFERHRRVTPLGRPKGQRCPLDRLSNGERDGNGCFYSCSVFQASRTKPRPSREQAIASYEARIAEVEATIAALGAS